MEGRSIIVSAPSGAGKTTIVKHLLRNIPQLAFSVSATSRPARADETNGKDYYFLTEEGFKKRIEAGEFLEWEEVYPGRYYGTLKSELQRIWKEGKSVIFDLDVIGGCYLKEHFGDKALAVFVQPPSIEELASRLHQRSTETPETLKQRTEKARYEITFAERFDVVIINDELEKACSTAEDRVKQFLGI
jgi:guanylate kinase